MPDDKAQGLTHAERQDVEELSAPRSPVIYEVVRQQGEDELCRPDSSLFWSGIAAGITIMASVIVQAALRHKLPDAPWREAVSNIGYSVGFLMVILGRMQLFTEQTKQQWDVARVLATTPMDEAFRTLKRRRVPSG